MHHILHQGHQLFLGGVLALGLAASAGAFAAVAVGVLRTLGVDMVVGMGVLVVVGMSVDVLMGVGHTVVGVLVGMGVLMRMLMRQAGVLVVNVHRIHPPFGFSIL